MLLWLPPSNLLRPHSRVWGPETMASWRPGPNYLQMDPLHWPEIIIISAAVMSKSTQTKPSCKSLQVKCICNTNVSHRRRPLLHFTFWLYANLADIISSFRHISHWPWPSTSQILRIRTLRIRPVQLLLSAANR